MTAPHDPVRWRDGADEWRDLAHDLAKNAGDGPTPEQEARLLAQLTALQTSTRDAPRTSKLLGKLGLFGLALLAGLGTHHLASKPSATPERAASQPRAPEVAREQAEPQAPSGEDPVPDVAPSSEPPAAPTAQPAPQRQRKKVPQARPNTEAGVEHASDPVAELALLTRARRVLLTDPARTLELVSEHHALYPRGQFAEEREVIAVEALTRAGQADAARARGSAFFRAYPSSAHAVRMRELLSPRL
jgi:hypothetical protein